MKLKSLVKYVGLASLAMGANASFASLTFDPDGSGGLSAVQATQFDWSPTSFLADGGITAITNYVTSQGTCREVNCSFQVYTHASLISTKDGNTTTTPTGLDTDFEITMVLSFTETVTGVLGSLATFAIDTAAPMFFQLFYDDTPDRDDVTGSGFGDGRLIANATAVASSTGLFAVTDFTPVPFDGYDDGAAPADDYPNIDSVTGIGSQSTVTVSGFTLDPTFFLTDIASFLFNFGSISINTPFSQVDPSECFTGTKYAGAVGTTQAQATANCDTVFSQMTVNDTQGGIRPWLNADGSNGVGTVNGNGAGPDFMAQTDFNSAVNGAIPVPAPLALIGVGMLALGWSQRKKR